LSNLYY